ncbi:MAG: phosphonate C-P lyase system protein PhnL [Desulfuromonadales bacterium]|nr:phosphonate C-P lyase system protein PhnL [Desulfuromonadales bacterium]
MQPVLIVEGLAKEFFLHEQRETIPSCSNVTLESREGKLTAIVGPTGAGKSSVLKCIYRTYQPSTGRIIFRDQAGQWLDLARADEHQMLRLRQREIGFVTQFLSCLPRKSALDIVAEPLVASGVHRTAARARAGEMLARLAVPQRLWGVPPATFSGGEKQRVNLARGLISRPRLLLLDEPTASLDPGTTDLAVKLIEALKEDGVAMIAIFHQPDLVRRLADDVVELAPPMAVKGSIRECLS